VWDLFNLSPAYELGGDEKEENPSTTSNTMPNNNPNNNMMMGNQPSTNIFSGSFLH